MSVGLPGHTTASMVVMSVQPPLSLSQASPQSLSKSVLARGGSSSMGGSQERRGQRKNKKGKSKNKSLDSQTSSGEDSIHRSSSSESSSTVYRKHWSHQSQHRSDSNVHRRNRGWGVTQGKRDVSSSESDVSDSEASRLKAVCCKIRLQAYSSLALIFQVSLFPNSGTCCHFVNLFSSSFSSLVPFNGVAVGSPHLLLLLVVIPT